jgi:hypothetical protein
MCSNLMFKRYKILFKTGKECSLFSHYTPKLTKTQNQCVHVMNHFSPTIQRKVGSRFQYCSVGHVSSSSFNASTQYIHSMHPLKTTQYIHSMHPLNASIQCIHSIHPIHAPIQCIHPMRPSKASIQCIHSMHPFNAFT